MYAYTLGGSPVLQPGTTARQHTHSGWSTQIPKTVKISILQLLLLSVVCYSCLFSTLDFCNRWFL